MGLFGKLRGPFRWRFGFASSSTLLYGSKARDQTGISHQEFLKIISGGQTGVDRGALDAALALGFSCGGWCPAGRLAEDGTIPKRYPVVELPNAGYAERTARNVADSDGTLIISNGEPTGGTRETIDRCAELNKPYLIIDHAKIPTNEIVELVLRFVGDHHVRLLNVAGPRASQWREGHKFGEQIVSTVLRRLSGHERSREYSS
jgi:hypothetical protein